MGTSLSGLTPQTTFDGLLKVGDNDPLTADLKAISDGSGNDSAIQLSTGELKVMGQFNVDTDTAATEINLRGNSLTINQVYQANETTYNSIQMINSSGIRLKNGNITTLAAKGNKVGIGTADPTETLQIKGSGNDNTTNSLLVQNSDGTQLFAVRDDGRLLFGTSSNLMYLDDSLLQTWQINNSYFSGQRVGIGVNASGSYRLHIKGSGSDNTTTSLLVQNSNGADVLQTLDNGSVGVGGPANSAYRVTMTSGVLRLKDLLFGQTGSTAINNTSLLTMKWNGSTGIGISGGGAIDAAARLHIKGEAPSGTPLNNPTALLVQNSAGNDLLKVTDDGATVLKNQLTVQHTGFGQWLKVVHTGTNLSLYGYALAQADHNFQSRSNYLGSNFRQFDTGFSFGAGALPPNTADTLMTIKGSGNDATTTALLVQNSAGSDMFKITDDKAVNIYAALRISNNQVLGWDGGANAIRYFYQSGVGNHVFYTNSGTERMKLNNDGNLGIGETTPTARLHIVSENSLNTDFAIKAYNTNGNELLSVRNDGTINLLSGKSIKFSGSEAFTGNINTGELRLAMHSTYGLTIIESPLKVIGSGNDATTTALLVQNSDADNIVEVLDSKRVNITAADGATGLHIDSVNGSTTGNAITIGSDDNKFRLGNYYNYGVIAVPNSKLLLSTAQGVGIGDTFTNASGGTARLFVKGSGATTATTALLVENSAGADLLKVEDGGNIVTSGFTFQSNIIKPNINGYIGLDRNNNRTFSVIDSSGARTYLNIQSSITSNFADVSINTDHLVVKKEGSVAVGTSTLDTSAKLQVDSTTQGFLPPRMTSEQKTAITSPAAGLMVYDTDQNQMNYWNGSAWIAF